MLSQKLLDELKKWHKKKNRNIKELMRQIANDNSIENSEEYWPNSIVYITQNEIDDLLNENED